MMSVGDVLNVCYDTGEMFTGSLVSVREIAGKGTLLLINDETVGYRSIYAHKCVGPILFRSAGELISDKA